MAQTNTKSVSSINKLDEPVQRPCILEVPGLDGLGTRLALGAGRLGRLGLADRAAQRELRLPAQRL